MTEGRWLFGLLVGIVCLPVHSLAQSGPAPYLPLESWEHDLAERLRARGLLPELSGITRPYRADLVKRGLAILDSLEFEEEVELSPLERAWISRLNSVIKPLTEDGSPDGEGIRWRLSVAPAVQAGTSANRDRFFEWGPHGAWTGVQFEALAVAGPLVLHTTPRFDHRPAVDPRYQGAKNPFGTNLAIREETSYALVAGTLGGITGELFLGRIGRNWGPDPTQSLNLANLEYTYDQLSWSIGLGPVRFSQLLGLLETFRPDSLRTFRRYFVGHRLDAHLGGAVDLALSRSYLRTTRGLFNVNFLDPTASGDSNTFTTLDFAWRPWRGGELMVQALLDDPTGDARSTGAIAVGLRTAGISDWMDLDASYTIVGAQTYRPLTSAADFYAFWNTGIGEDRSDFDRVSLRMTFYPNADTRLALAVERQRQGRGDPRVLRDPTPGNLWLDPPSVILTRIGVDARLRIGKRGELRMDWGPIHRDLEIFNPRTDAGWHFDGWISYYYSFDLGGLIKGSR